MADLTTKYTVTPAWSSSARITASAELPILISNTSQFLWLVCAVTDNDTIPNLNPVKGEGIPVQQGESFAMTLANGQRFWMATRSGDGDYAAVTV